MSFKDAANAHLNAASETKTAATLNRAAESARSAVALQSCMDTLAPIIKPLLEVFVQEATEMGYAAQTDLHASSPHMFWWTLSFLPKMNAKPSRDREIGPRREAVARISVSSDGHCTLDWSPQGPTGLISDFSHSERCRHIHLQSITAQLIGDWLDEFATRMLAHQVKCDEAS